MTFINKIVHHLVKLYCLADINFSILVGYLSTCSILLFSDTCFITGIYIAPELLKLMQYYWISITLFMAMFCFIIVCYN